MGRARNRIPALLLTCSIASLFSCSVNQTIAVKADGSGTAVLHVELTRMFREYLLNLAEVSGQADAAAQGKVFDLEGIKKGFEGRPGVTVTKISSPSSDVLDIELSYRSVRDVFADDRTLTSTGVVVYSESGGVKTLKFHLDKSNFSRLSTLFPALSDPVFAGMGPQPNDEVSEEEYLQMIEFSLGAEGPALMKRSYVTLTIRPEGSIVSQTGGRVSGDSVVFKIPLLRVLVLDKPLDYSVSFK
jgi:hypothetical protein